jgi:hypothetical protein
VSTALIALECGDDPSAWADLGLPVDGSGRCVLSGVTVLLDGTGGGLRRWMLQGSEGPAAIDGIPTTWSGASPAVGEGQLDHVVVFTDSRDRTVEALVAAGGDLRRSGGPPQLPAPMAFVRLGSVIVEVAENPKADRATLWGLVAVVGDVDALAAAHPGSLGTPRDAVQPGRRIVTARPREGLDCALAFMTPRVRAHSGQ